MPRILNKKEKGFTLVELMVAVSIFAIVVTIAMGAIFTVVDANKKAQSLKSVMNNLNFALETITRTIKTGTIKSVVPTVLPDTSSNSTIEIVAQNLDDVTYSLSDGQIMRTTINTSGTITSAITAPEVKIESFKLLPLGLYPNDKMQPMIVMVVKGKVQMNAKISSEFNIQTTITQRLIDS